MKYARLSTIKDNIARSKGYINEKKRESRQTESKSRKLLLAEKIDDEKRVLEKLEAAYQAARKMRKSRA